MAEKYAMQLQVRGPKGTRRQIVLREGTTFLGRRGGNDVLLNHPQVSRQHAQIDRIGADCRITDLDSTHGTTVNGEDLIPGTPRPLSPGAIIRLVPFQLRFEQTPVERAKAEDPEKTAAPSPEPEIQKPELAGSQPPEPPSPPNGDAPLPSRPPPGMSKTESRLVQFLPGIYHTKFMHRFLALFEAILRPIEWNVDNFDLFLDPRTAPPGFLPWLMNWFEITLDTTWNTEQKRTLLAEAHDIYPRRGTPRALARVLEIYTDTRPEIADQETDVEPFTFTVTLPVSENEFDRNLLEQIIDRNKPAHTSYRLRFEKNSR